MKVDQADKADGSQARGHRYHEHPHRHRHHQRARRRGSYYRYRPTGNEGHVVPSITSRSFRSSIRSTRPSQPCSSGLEYGRNNNQTGSRTRTLNRTALAATFELERLPTQVDSGLLKSSSSSRWSAVDEPRGTGARIREIDEY